MMSFDNRVEKALSKQKIRSDEECLLDGTRLRDLTAEESAHLGNIAKGAYLLSLNNCKLNDISALPMLVNVEVLEMQDNILNDESKLNQIPMLFPNLQMLLLSGNKIVRIESLAFVTQLEKLVNLEIGENPFSCQMSDYRQRIFGSTTNIQVIDGVDRKGNQITSDDEDLQEDMEDVDEELERKENLRMQQEFYDIECTPVVATSIFGAGGQYSGMLGDTMVEEE